MKSSGGNKGNDRKKIKSSDFETIKLDGESNAFESLKDNFSKCCT
jgi:hypothetical protein